jgi:large subunit ribosomal protein L30
MSDKIAVVRIRGNCKLDQDVIDTLKMLNLPKQNYCTVVANSPGFLGMIKKAKDFITWGEIDEDTLKLLQQKRQEKVKDHEGKETPRKYFRLSPPRKGFERKGIKVQYTVGGALGYRGKEINELIKRMI